MRNSEKLFLNFSPTKIGFLTQSCNKNLTQTNSLTHGVQNKGDTYILVCLSLYDLLVDTRF